MSFSDDCKQDKLEKEVAHICNCEYEYFLNKANVVGICLSYKVKGGFRTNQLCIQVFVSRKLFSNELNSQDLIPNLYKGIPTDVVQTGILNSCSLTQKVRPAIGGYIIANEHEVFAGGTLGCLVSNKNDYYILSNNHVLANNNKAPIGTKIIQPSYAYGGRLKTDVVAILSKFIPKKPIGTLRRPTNYADCAIAKVINKSLVTTQIAFIGTPNGTIVPRLNQEVKKVGFKTELTTGKITSIHDIIQVGYPDLKKRALFREQISTTSMSTQGDSGAVLLDKNNYVVGLIMSSSKTECTCNPIDIVLKQLDVRLVTSKDYY
ncbi:trypsin-like peptidase domain-containing protein [Clostridium botulinum C/D]|uniref:trypsin-like peptidase domain-containing protein n=1 Tax=Clostridium botulinum TaxID=1491 RepID=UPI001E2F855C|nr:trypsin-like peptidase domain-containing protein [Clostridium botulinum]MCD3282433.1 trypsin-like peptidase domain-containing protein [Clostridium botulinum C/D]